MDDLYDFTDKLPLLESGRFCSCMLCSDDCHCGANTEHEWEWDKQHSTYSDLSTDNLDVEFHRTISRGTGIVRGSKLLEKGRHHYWEIEMLTRLYGTDVMVGVGTSKMDFTDNRINSYNYCSLLGIDNESFGYSYKGYIQQAGKKRKYGTPFNEGNIMGIYLDTWKGTLEFFINQKPLGVAFTGLKDATLYPMVCSTAKGTKMRLIRSSSVPVSLQTECLAALRPLERKRLSTMVPGLRHLSQSVFAKVLQKH